MTMHAEFDQRIARIEAGVNSFRSTFYVGIDGIYDVPVRAKRKTVSRAQRVITAVYPLAMALAVLLGVVAHGLVLWLRYQAQNLLPALDDPGAEMGLQIGVAACLAVLATHLIQLRGWELMLLAVVGAVLGACVFHNLVHAYPQPFQAAFSPAWVVRVQGETSPASVVWLGHSITF